MKKYQLWAGAFVLMLGTTVYAQDVSSFVSHKSYVLKELCKDIKRDLLAHQKLEEKMKKLQVLDYCVVGNWVYYATLGDQEGFHKMLLDGTQNSVICDFSKVCSIDGSTSVSSEYKGDYILYTFQQLRQYDASGQLEAPHPSYFYKLNLSNNTLEKIAQ